MAAATGAAAFGAIISTLLPQEGVEEGTGFGTNPGLRVNRKIFAILHGGELIVKLPAEQCAQLVADGRAYPFEIGHRRMREWIRVPEVDEQEWLRLASDARDFVAG